ncbi:MAG: phosphodiester glycosidase family protein [Proteobacteria bacterium]|nr:phosphodiester glycosidase family protein [Pseudomonadota bacterium]
MRRPSTLVVLFLIMVTAICARAEEPADRLERTTAAGVPLQVIRVNLADRRVRVRVEVAAGFPGADEPFADMIARTRPTIAVNGAYFSKSSLKPIGDIVIGGRLVSQGLMGTALAITRTNEATIRRVERDRSQDWSAYETVLACGPALVLGGRPDARPQEEGFRDPHIMGSTERMGVGITPDRHLLIVHTLAPVSFGKWAEVMRALGCSDAMNLDAGASLAMYYRGRTLIPAGRRLTNLLTVKIER